MSYMYDNLYSKVSDSLVLQVSSLLRAEDKPDEIEFSVRRFQQQQMGTRLCGSVCVLRATRGSYWHPLRRVGDENAENVT